MASCACCIFGKSHWAEARKVVLAGIARVGCCCVVQVWWECGQLAGDSPVATKHWTWCGLGQHVSHCDVCLMLYDVWSMIAQVTFYCGYWIECCTWLSWCNNEDPFRRQFKNRSRWSSRYPCWLVTWVVTWIRSISSLLLLKVSFWARSLYFWCVHLFVSLLWNQCSCSSPQSSCHKQLQDLVDKQFVFIVGASPCTEWSPHLKCNNCFLCTPTKPWDKTLAPWPIETYTRGRRRLYTPRFPPHLEQPHRQHILMWFRAEKYHLRGWVQWGWVGAEGLDGIDFCLLGGAYVSNCLRGWLVNLKLWMLCFGNEFQPQTWPCDCRCHDLCYDDTSFNGESGPVVWGGGVMRNLWLNPG